MIPIIHTTVASGLDVRTITSRQDWHIARAAARVRAGLDRVSGLAVMGVRNSRDSIEALARAEQAVNSRMARAELESMLKDVYEAVIPPAAQLGYEQALRIQKRNLIRDIWLEFVLQFLGQEAGLLIRRITRATLNDVRRILAGAVEEGLGIEKMAIRLETASRAINRVRGRRIARTEVISASNAGHIRGGQETGLELKKVWLATTTDDRTRFTHLQAHGIYHADPIDMDELFVVGGFGCMYPASSELPAHERINCRCTIFYLPVN